MKRFSDETLAVIRWLFLLLTAAGAGYVYWAVARRLLYGVWP